MKIIELDERLQFATGCVVNKDLVVVASNSDISTQSQTQMLQYRNGEWSHFMVDWPVVSMGATRNEGMRIFSLGVDGQVHIADKNGFYEETIPGSGQIGLLSELRIIDENVFAVGMGRQVYRRDALGDWQQIAQSVLQPMEEEEIAGFLSLDGSDDHNLYAVGYQGEMYHYDGVDWHMVKCPVEVDLHCIKCISKGLCYAVGQGGTIIRGWGDHWEIVPQSIETDDLWSVEVYGEAVYFASERQIIKLEDEKFSVVYTGDPDVGTSGHLCAGDGSLWSIGRDKCIQLFYQ